jgi:O-antigen/teichoic acid export membrane protein
MTAVAERGLVRDGLVYAVGLALRGGLWLLVLPAATRILGPEEFGVATAALVVASVLSIVFTLGCNFAILRIYFDEPETAERTEWAMLLRAQLLLGAALAGVTWLLGPLWSGIYNGVSWSGALQLAVLLGFAQAAQTTALSVLRAARRVYAFVGVVLAQVVVGGTLAVLLAQRHGPTGLVGGLAIGASVGAVLGLALTYRRASWSWIALRAGLLLSIPFAAVMLSGWVFGLSDRVLIERFLGLASLGTYQVAYALAIVPILLTDALQTAWLPHFYRLDASTKRAIPERLATRVTVAVAAVAAGVVLLAPAIGALLAPSDFDVPMTVVALVVSATFVRASYLIAFAVLSDAKESRSIARASSLGAVVNVVLNLALIPVWGLTGAALTTLVAYGVISLVALRRTEIVIGYQLNLAHLVRLWTAAAVVMLVLSVIPTNAAGWAVRGTIAALMGIAAVAALQRTRDSYEAVVAPVPV